MKHCFQFSCPAQLFFTIETDTDDIVNAVTLAQAFRAKIPPSSEGVAAASDAKLAPAKEVVTCVNAGAKITLEDRWTS